MSTARAALPNNIVERTGRERPAAHDERWAIKGTVL
jgi:hypothetical protein